LSTDAEDSKDGASPEIHCHKLKIDLSLKPWIGKLRKGFRFRGGGALRGDGLAQKKNASHWPSQKFPRSLAGELSGVARAIGSPDQAANLQLDFCAGATMPRSRSQLASGAAY
jgi:hypothetical protein